MGQLTEVEDETGATKLRYDERGLLIGVETPLGDVVQYEYNQYAEKTGLIYPDGTRAEYAYDGMSRLLSVTEPNGSETAYTYDALGRRTSASDGTLKTEYGYDAVGNLIRQSNEVVDLTYRYDLNGRMTEEVRTEGGTIVRSGFAYDKAGQLTSFRRSDGYEESFTYDPVGNMVEKTLNGTKIAMTYDAANELKTMESPQGKLTYAYDLNGNLTQKTLGSRTDTYSYDARNHLKQYRGYDNYQVKYSYNALGMLHARESSGSHSRTTLEELIAGKEEGDDPDGDGEAHRTTYVYDLTQPYYQVLTETADGVTTSYTYGLERLAAYADDTRTAYLYDGRGSVIQTRGSLGTQTMAYSAYGELLTEKVSGYGYNGEYYDAATGMLNLRARQYEPAQGRFSQRDSLKGWVTSPRSLNAYLYCQNDAINYFDASGAAMVAVNMTDGGGGRKSDTSPSSFFRKANQTIKTAVTQAVGSAAAAAKAAQQSALTQAQVSSILKESRNPANVWEKARANRTQAQATTPTVVGHSFLRSVKKFACMTQEEYDAGSEVYGPQISNSTPQLIEAQNEDNIQSAKDNLVIAGGFGVTLQLGIAVAFCFEVTWDPVTSRPSVQLLSGYGEGIPSISFFVYGSYCDAPSLEAYYNSTTTAMGGGALFLGTDRLFLTNNETGELYSGRSYYLSTGFSPEAHVIQYQSLTFHSDSDMPVYDYNFDDLLSSE